MTLEDAVWNGCLHISTCAAGILVPREVRPPIVPHTAGMSHEHTLHHHPPLNCRQSLPVRYNLSCGGCAALTAAMHPNLPQLN